MNVLYLLSDDMRADIGAYGISSVHTPHLDKLASSSFLFQHAYSQISVCSPSRQSFMTGLRPDTNKVFNFIDSNPLDTQAVPGHFRDHGYLTLGLGKTFHEELGSWNADEYFNTTGSGRPYYKYKANECPIGNEGGGQCIIPDEDIYDYHLRTQTIDYLKHAAEWSREENGKPFFLMAGFRDPHAPWAAPKRMYDLYDEDGIDLPPPESKTLGKDTPLIAWSAQLNVCLANGTSFPYSYDIPVSDEVMRNQRRAYYSSVSYVDEHIGAILDTLEEEGLADSTIVVFHSDHGYALGEHGYWEKKSNFDATIRVPLLIKVPGITDDGGVVSDLVELIDAFPTISSLAGLPPPMNVDGVDLSGLFSAESSDVEKGRNRVRGSRQTVSQHKDAAYHQFPACNTPSFNSTRRQCNYTPASDFDFMGYSIRTKDWRYTIWLPWDGKILEATWDGDYADELYDHAGDDSSAFGKYEQVNMAAERQDVAKMLRRKLKAYFSSEAKISRIS